MDPTLEKMETAFDAKLEALRSPSTYSIGFWDRSTVRISVRLLVLGLMVFFSLGIASRPVSADAIWAYNALLAWSYIALLSGSVLLVGSVCVDWYQGRSWS